MTETTAKEKEITQNYEVFLEKLPSLIDRHRGKYALMHSREIVGIYDTVRDAVQTGEIMYKDGMYSVQEVTDEAVDLGFQSRVMSAG